MIFSSERRIVRFLHAGDLHLDSPFSRLSPQMSEERRQELRDSFSAVMRIVREKDVDLVLLPGDLFDGEYVTSGTAALLTGEIAACPKCRFVIAPGNHDPYTKASLYASGRLPENVSVFTNEALSSFTFPELNTTVWGWAFLSDKLEVSPLAGHKVTEPERLNLICGHADFGVPLSPYGPVTSADLSEFGADYAAFAHKHIPVGPSPVGAHGLYAYCGCLEGRSFDEPGRGGVILVTATRNETDDRWTLTPERIEIAHRRYETETVDLTGIGNNLEVARRIKAVVENKGYGEDTALRVIFTGSTPPDFAIPPEANGAALGLYYLELIDRTVPNYDARYLEKDLTVRGELYRSLLPKLTSGTPEERATAARALRMGLAALEGNDFTQI